MYKSLLPCLLVWSSSSAVGSPFSVRSCPETRWRHHLIITGGVTNTDSNGPVESHFLSPIGGSNPEKLLTPRRNFMTFQ